MLTLIARRPKGGNPAWAARLALQVGHPLRPTFLDPSLSTDAYHTMQHLEAVPLAAYLQLQGASLLQLTRLAQESAVWCVLGDLQVRVLPAVQPAEV